MSRPPTGFEGTFGAAVAQKVANVCGDIKHFSWESSSG